MARRLNAAASAPFPKSGLDLLRVLLIAAGLLALLLATLGLLRAGVLYYIYTLFLAKVTEATGLDLWLARAVTLALLAAVWLFPWSLLFLPWIGRIKSRVLLWVVLLIAALSGMELVTRDVYFSRLDGRPLKYYARTIEGYRISSSPGADPVYGIPYRPVTSEVVEDMMLSKCGSAEPQKSAPQEHPLEGPLGPGRYIFTDPRPSGAIDDFRFTLTEVDLTASSLLVHVDVDSHGASIRARIKMLLPDGTHVAYKAKRFKEGDLRIEDDCYSFFFGSHGAFTMEFPPLPGISAFTIAANDQPLFAVNLRNAEFQSF